MTSLHRQPLSHKYAAIDVSRSASAVGLNILPPVLERVSTPQPAEMSGINLPSLATANDLRDLIRYLKKYPEGVTIIEALSEVKKRILDPRKISAYEIWGVIERHGDWLRLSELGWEFARKLASEAELFRSIIDRVEHYRKVIGLIHSQQLKLITHEDIARYWRVHFSDSLDWHHLKSVESHVVCFLHLCQAADLGSLTVGKRGQPARMRIDLDEVESFIVGALPTWEPERPPHRDLPAIRYSTSNELKWEKEQWRVCLSVRRSQQSAAQFQALLELLGIECDILERENLTTLTSSEPIFETMRRCVAGVFVITIEDCFQDDGGILALRPEIQSEISAAYLFYNKQVLLLWDERVPLPETWVHLVHGKFDGQLLDWETGVSLTKALLAFKG